MVDKRRTRVADQRLDREEQVRIEDRDGDVRVNSKTVDSLPGVVRPTGHYHVPIDPACDDGIEHGSPRERRQPVGEWVQQHNLEDDEALSEYKCKEHLHEANQLVGYLLLVCWHHVTSAP